MPAREVVEVGGVNLQSKVVGGFVAPLEGGQAARRASIALVGGDGGNQPPAGAPLVTPK